MFDNGVFDSNEFDNTVCGHAWVQAAGLNDVLREATQGLLRDSCQMCEFVVQYIKVG